MPFNWEICDSVADYKNVEVCYAADVLYDREAIVWFVHVVSLLLSQNSNLLVIVATTIRNPDTFTFFMGQLQQKRYVIVY